MNRLVPGMTSFIVTSDWSVRIHGMNFSVVDEKLITWPPFVEVARVRRWLF